MEKKDYLHVLLLWMFLIVCVVIFLFPMKMYGSVTDFISQHSVFPDYFRKLFYETGNLFPSLAMNIGGGQNIYYFSYYGFLSPIVLLSYLFPFIPMIDYIMVSSFLSILISVYLFYRLLKNHGFECSVCFWTTFMFACAAPLLFHSHRHIMFVNYMPFLLLGLIGIDLYFKHGKRWLYAFSVFLMIMTSYYYSVGGLLCFVIYGVYVFLKENGFSSIRTFLIDGIRFLVPMIIGIMLASILLLPTIYALFQGRVESSTHMDLLSLLIPNLDLDHFLYGNYAVGLSAFALFAWIVGTMCKKKEQIFMGICLLLLTFVPIFLYLLNGTIYIRAKALIPFLPLYCLFIAFYLRDLFDHRFSFRHHFLFFLGICLICFGGGYHEWLFYVDLGICFVVILSYFKFQKKWIVYGLILVAGCGLLFESNFSEKYILRDNYQKIYSKDRLELVQDTLNEDTQFYRFLDLDHTLETVNRVYDIHHYQTSLYSSSYNPFYQTFYQFDIGNPVVYRNQFIMATSNNVMFHKLMGVRYLLSSLGSEPMGYQLVRESEDYGIYQNDDVLALGFSTPYVYSLDDYQKLSFPYRNELLLQQIVIDQDVNSSFESSVQEVKLDYDYELPDSISVSNHDNIVVDVVSKSTVSLRLKEPIDGDILFLRFDVKPMNCSVGDAVITINGVKNNLTCKQWMYYNGNTTFEYTLSSNDPITSLDITFNKGHYELSDIHSYVLDGSAIEGVANHFDMMDAHMDLTSGDEINGTIDVKQDGWFATTIPYDEGFQVYVDDKEVSISLVNQAFIGFPISSGKHSIRFVYQALWRNYGLIGSGVGVVLFGCLIWFDVRKSSVVKIP